MARRKKEEGGGGGSPAWMATFSDLMNLLLCFFVLLFAFSSVDAEKFAEIAASMNSSFSIFNGGATAIGDGKLVSQGVSQLDYLSEYYSEMGLEAGQDSEAGKTESGEGEQGVSENSGGSTGINQGSETGNPSVSEIIEDYKQQAEEKQKKQTETMYEEVADATAENKLQDTVDVSIDENYQYVRIVLSGAILFDTGQDSIRKEAEPILDKLGDILKIYDKYLIKIEGHTDNVPISNSKFSSNMWLSTARATRVFEFLTRNKRLDPKTLEASGRGEYEPLADNTTAEGRSKNRRVEIKIYSK